MVSIVPTQLGRSGGKAATDKHEQSGMAVAVDRMCAFPTIPMLKT